MQLPNLQFIRSIPVWGPRLYEAFSAVQQQTTRIETQGNLNATGSPPVPPPPDALKVTNGPSGEYQIAITHNGQFNRGTSFHVQWDTSPYFTNPHNIDLGASRNDSSLNLPGQTAYFRASAASPNGANSAWTYHGTQNRPTPVIGGVRGVRAPGMGSGTGAPGDQSGGPGPVQQRNSESGYNWTAQQRTAGAGFGASAQGSPAGIGASTMSGGGGGGGGLTLTEAQIAAAETLTITGTGNAITGTTNPTYSVRTVGGVLRYIPTHANTANVTISENGITAAAVTKNGTTALVGGEFVVGKTYFLMWDGTEYQIVGVLSPISAALLGSDTHGVPIVAPNSGVTAATYGDATHVGQFAVSAQGQITAAANVPITFPGGFVTAPFTPVLAFGGSSTGITYGTQTGYSITDGNLVICWIYLVLTSKGSATGAATITGLPFTVGTDSIAAGGFVEYALNFLGLTSVPTVLSAGGGTVASLYQWGATGVAALTDAVFTNTTNIALTVIYHQ